MASVKSRITAQMATTINNPNRFDEFIDMLEDFLDLREMQRKGAPDVALEGKFRNKYPDN